MKLSEFLIRADGSRDHPGGGPSAATCDRKQRVYGQSGCEFGQKTEAINRKAQTSRQEARELTENSSTGGKQPQLDRTKSFTMPSEDFEPDDGRRRSQSSEGSAQTGPSDEETTS